MVYVELRNLLKKKIQKETADHGSKTKLAKEVGISRPTIDRIISTGKAREDVKDKLENHFFPQNEPAAL